MKYHTRRHEIDAVQFDGSAESAETVLKWLGNKDLHFAFSHVTHELEIDGYGEQQHVKPFDWVIRQGVWAVTMPPAEFERTYEAV